MGGRPIRCYYQTDFNIWDRMLGDEDEQQDVGCHHGDEDALRDPLCVFTIIIIMAGMAVV